MRLYPSTAASSPVQIPNNKNITVQKHNDSWSSTTYDGHSGFVMSKFLTIGGSTGGDGGSTGGDGGSTGGGGTGGTTTSNFTKGNFGKTNAVAVNVRKEAKKTVEGYGQVACLLEKAIVATLVESWLISIKQRGTRGILVLNRMSGIWFIMEFVVLMNHLTLVL